MLKRKKKTVCESCLIDLLLSLRVPVEGHSRMESHGLCMLATITSEHA